MIEPRYYWLFQQKEVVWFVTIEVVLKHLENDWEIKFMKFQEVWQTKVLRNSK